MAEKITRATPVRALTHPSDSRANIPAAELESFARRVAPLADETFSSESVA